MTRTGAETQTVHRQDCSKQFYLFLRLVSYETGEFTRSLRVGSSSFTSSQVQTVYTFSPFQTLNWGRPLDSAALTFVELTSPPLEGCLPVLLEPQGSLDSLQSPKQTQFPRTIFSFPGPALDALDIYSLLPYLSFSSTVQDS